MGRKLTGTTLIDGVVYDAGTDESEIAGVDTVTADVWDSEGDAEVGKTRRGRRTAPADED